MIEKCSFKKNDRFLCFEQDRHFYTNKDGRFVTSLGTDAGAITSNWANAPKHP